MVDLKKIQRNFLQSDDSERGSQEARSGRARSFGDRQPGIQGKRVKGWGSIFGFTGANIAEGNEMVKWAEQLDGVKAANICISEEVFDWLEKEVESRSTAS